MKTTTLSEKKVKTLEVTSKSFGHNLFIPAQYSCEGNNVNPPLTIKNLPEGTKSLTLIVEDPDAPIRPWTHWLVWNIHPSEEIQENSIPGIEGLNDFNMHHYGGPCPPPPNAHRYFFKVYALDAMLKLNPQTTKNKLEKAMNNHVIGYGEISGLYKRY